MGHAAQSAEMAAAFKVKRAGFVLIDDTPRGTRP